MNVISEKAGGRAHRAWLNVLPTPDPWAFYVPPQSPVREADGSEWSSPYPVILQFWPERYYQVCHLLKESAPAFYCNIITPPVFHPNDQVVSFIDLELDVIVDGGQAALADKAEFEATNLPALWRANAEQAAHYVQNLASAKSGPFSTATTAFWHAWLQFR